MNSTQFSTWYVMGPIPIPMEDPIIHTDERPWCSDTRCPCHDVVGTHSNEEAYLQHIAYPLRDGLLTADEANRIYFDEQLVRDQLAYEDEVRAAEWSFNVGDEQA